MPLGKIHMENFGSVPSCWYKCVLGRVDGFDQDEARDEGDEGCKVPFGFLAA